MARRRKSKLLFDVVSEGKTKGQHSKGLVMPEWMRRNESASIAGDQGNVGGDESTDSASGGFSDVDNKVEADISARQVPSVVEVADGRVNLSLNFASCVVCLLTLVLFMVLAFMLGRNSAPGVVLADSGTVSRQEATASGGAQAAGPTGPVEVVQREVGKYYLVIMRMSDKSEKSLLDAKDIVAYLAKYGHRAEIRVSGDCYVVWSLEGVSSPTSEAASKQVSEMRGLGDRYSAERNRAVVFIGRDSSGQPQFVKYYEGS